MWLGVSLTPAGGSANICPVSTDFDFDSPQWVESFEFVHSEEVVFVIWVQKYSIVATTLYIVLSVRVIIVSFWRQESNHLQKREI